MKLITYNSHIIFAFSDTHGNHRKISVPEEADILICAGDAVEDDLKGDEQGQRFQYGKTCCINVASVF